MTEEERARWVELICDVRKMLADELGMTVSTGLAEWDDGQFGLTFTFMPKKANVARVS